MNLDVEDGDGGQAVFHLMPGGSAVEGGEDAELGAGEQEVRVDRIFADHVNCAGVERDPLVSLTKLSP